MTQTLRFEQLQAKAKAAYELERSYSIDLCVRYGSVANARAYAKKSSYNRYEHLHARSSKAFDRFFAFLQTISPRNWETGVGGGWIRDSLTYADAITTGPLSALPSVPYGSTIEDVRRFAQAL